MQKFGMAVGIFDMLTIAKIDFLNNLRIAYDSLTVSIISDSLSEILTGKKPVVSVNDRMKMIGELKSVNKVVLLDNIDDFYALKNNLNDVFIYDDVKNPDFTNITSDNSIDDKNRYSCDRIKPLKGVIGYTTGVFDLFHIGHLNLLKKAKEQCDSLIVGVSTDTLVQQYKNKKPKIGFYERARIIENLKCVDAVVEQVTMDKYDVWGKLKYNVLFHGDDWKGSSMYLETEKKLEEVGVKTVYFPYTKGVSSTILSEKMSFTN